MAKDTIASQVGLAGSGVGGVAAAVAAADDGDASKGKEKEREREGRRVGGTAPRREASPAFGMFGRKMAGHRRSSGK